MALPGQQQQPSGGGSGQGPGATTGGLYTVPTKGYGMFSQETGKYTPRVAGMLENANQGAVRSWRLGGAPGLFGTEALRGQAADRMQGMANEEAEQGRAEWDENMRMTRLKGDLMQKLMSLFSGKGEQGGPGGNLNVGMPISPDPNLIAAGREEVNKQFQPREAAWQKFKGTKQRGAMDATFVGQGDAALAGEKASAMTRMYGPMMGASVNAYQPGLEAARINKQGQITPQLVMQALMGMG